MRRLASALAVAFVLGLSSPTFGSEHGQEKPILPEGFEALDTPLLADGLEKFQGSQYGEALKLFDGFVKLNPDDGRGHLFRGLTLNRLAAFRLALIDLLRAEALGQSFSRIDVEIAWAWLEAGNPGEARKRLEPYLAIHPDDAKAHEFLGRAWLGLGDLDAAEASLKRALDLDPDLEATVRFYLAAIENRRGNVLGAMENLAGIILGKPDSRLGKRLGNLFPQIQAAPSAKPWRVAATFGLATNNNVIALPDDSALPADISSKQSASKHVNLSGSYDLRRSPNDVLTAGYVFDARYQNELDGFDTFDNFGYLNYARRINPDVTGSILFSGEYTVVDDRAFRYEAALSPTVAYNLRENITLEGAYRIALSDYLTNTAAVNDRDGYAHTVTATGRYKLDLFDTRLSAAFSHTWADTDGANFDLQSNSIRLAFKSSLPWLVTVEGSATRTWDDYDNVHTLSTTTEPRDDRTNRFAARLTRPINDFITGFINFSRIEKSSNISFFSYEQDQWEAGLTFTF